MKALSLIVTVSALLFARQSHAQVLTTGEPATVTNGDRALPGTPQSMTVADEGASRGYIIGKRVDPDKKKSKAKSRAGMVTQTGDTNAPMRRSNKRSMRNKSKRDSIR